MNGNLNVRMSIILITKQLTRFQKIGKQGFNYETKYNTKLIKGLFSDIILLVIPTFVLCVSGVL